VATADQINSLVIHGMYVYGLMMPYQLLGPDHPDVAKQFCNLAILCSHMGRYEEVEHYNQRALEIFQLELDHNDPNITRTMNSLVRGGSFFSVYACTLMASFSHLF